MPYHDRFTGKPFDVPSDRLPHQIAEKCQTHDVHLINHCIMCGAPVCCPKCCRESMAELEEHKLTSSVRDATHQGE